MCNIMYDDLRDKQRNQSGCTAKAYAVDGQRAEHPEYTHSDDHVWQSVVGSAH